MVRIGSENVGYKRIIVIAIVSTTFAVVLDQMGFINKLAGLIPGSW